MYLLFQQKYNKHLQLEQMKKKKYLSPKKSGRKIMHGTSPTSNRLNEDNTWSWDCIKSDYIETGIHIQTREIIDMVAVQKILNSFST